MIGFILALAAAADSVLPSDLKRDVVREFAACVRRRAPDQASELLASEPSSKDEARQVRVIASAYNGCIKDRRVLSFNTGLLRGQLAELAFGEDAKLRERAASLPETVPVKPNTAQIDKLAAAAIPVHRDAVYADAFRAAFSRCVAGASPRTVTSMLATSPGGAAERAALIGAGQTLMQCMPEGVSYHIVPAELRPYLMYNLYYRAVVGVRAGARSHA